MHIITPPCAYCGKPLSARPKRFHMSRRDPFDDIESDSMEISCDHCQYAFKVEEDHRHTIQKARQRVQSQAYVIDKRTFERDPDEALRLLPFAPVHVKDGEQTILKFDQRPAFRTPLK